MEFNNIDAQPAILSEVADLAENVRTGLIQTPKRLSSRFLYDAEGSRLFQEIMHVPEYYLTRSEYEILDKYKADLLLLFGRKIPFDLIELGAGDGLKTKVLLRHFLDQNISFSYVPIDISVDVLNDLTAGLQRTFPDLSVEPQHDDYFNALERLAVDSDRRKVVLFLGSNIGNFTPTEAIDFYRQLADRLRPGDLMLTGFDLQKDPAVIQAAYSDKQGVTRAFNLNLLRRINRELDADFDLDAFDHYESYNPENGEARSYLVSHRKQTVQIRALAMTVDFQNAEVIHTEISRKFSKADIFGLADATGFSVAGWFADRKDYFADVIFRKV
ncbi:MAG: L-histidine N(alpha)-methyltransferase [Bacteroidetes bacterium]|nr:L-histidine N(alpha)-methyltransferase [Fibrella sp.]